MSTPKNTLLSALVGGTLAFAAVPAIAAVTGDTSGDATSTTTPGATLVQDEQAPPARDHDCPERDGSGESSGASSAAGASTAY